MDHHVVELLKEELNAYTSMETKTKEINKRNILGPNTIYTCTENLYIKTLTKSEDLLKTSSAIYTRSIKCFHAKFIIKPPGAMGFMPHQDYEYWRNNGYAGKSIHTIIIAIEKGTIANGTTQVIPGSHRMEIFRDSTFEYEIEAKLREKGFNAIPVELDPGDALIFHGNTIHKSNQNLSSTSRNFIVLSAVVADKG